MTLVVGLTGGIGVGKSTVAGLIGDMGALVVDVDALGREVLEPGGGAFDGVVARFGEGILADDGTIDRAALAAEVFGETSRLAELEAISHPAINRRIAAILDAAPPSMVVLDMAVLTESRLGWDGARRRYQRVIVVEAPEEVRVTRLVQRGMGEADARARMGAQASDRERRRLADLVITNDRGLDALAEDVARLGPTFEAWQQQEEQEEEAQR